MLPCDLEPHHPAAPLARVNVPHSRLRVGLRALAVAGVVGAGDGAQVVHVDACAVEAHVVHL